MAKLNGIRACVFDAYGTLFDVHSAVGRLRDRIGPDADALSQLWRTKQLEYTWLRALMGRHADFWQVTGEALDYALEATGIDPAGVRKPLMEAYLGLDAYPEVRDVLQQLKHAEYLTAILSNGEPEMLAAGAKSAGIDDLLDANLSIEATGIFKPHPRTYQIVVDRFDVRPDEVVFLSSNAWDVHGSSVFGFNAIWVNRRRAPAERLPGGPAAVLSDLTGLPGLLGL